MGISNIQIPLTKCIAYKWEKSAVLLANNAGFNVLKTKMIMLHIHLSI